MRGTYTATYLDQVARAFAKQRDVDALDVGAAFDLIVGTSTGGIIACALATAVPLREVVALYRDHGAAIFRRKLPEGSSVVLDLAVRSKALRLGEEELKTALKEKLGETTIGSLYQQRGIALAVPAVEMSQHRSWVFKTPHIPGTNHRDDGYSLVDVCLATSAAPIFRSLAAVGHADGAGGGYNVFVDGGLWANNPVLVGLIDALDMAEPRQPIEIFCLGTCPIPSGEQIRREDVHRGLGQWKFGGRAAELAIDAQQFAYDHMVKKLAQHLDHPCRIIRFPSEKVPAALIPYLGLDDTRSEAMDALVNQARTDADMTNSKCAYRGTDLDAEAICSLFESAPVLTNPPFARPLARPSVQVNSPAPVGDQTHA